MPTDDRVTIPAEPARLIATLHRLASSQRNLPLFKTEQEHTDMRDAARLLEDLTTHDPLAEPWLMIEMGWDIESRAEFERDAPKMGFKHPLSMAIHHMHKRCVKDNPDFLRSASALSGAADAPQEKGHR